MIGTVPFEFVLFAGGLLLLLGILAGKVSSRLGLPSLVLFLALGMLAGSEGAGGIHFDDPRLVQSLGVVALSYILFAGGLDTNWQNIRPNLLRGLSMSSLGVVITASITGWFAHVVLDFSMLEGLLLGAIVSSTDAAAVFSILRSRNISLKGELKPLLELESGSNDPMAVFLTTAFILLLTDPNTQVYHLVPMLLWQMAVGALAGYAMGRGAVFLINHLRLEYEGLYSVLSLTLVLFNFGATALLKGNGFLSVYVAGLVMGNSVFIQKRSLLRFHDGLAWLMQITMFVVLGLQIFPSHLVPVITVGLLTAACLMLVARPVSVFISLLFSRLNFREKALVSWVGLRGAVPIILATFPLLAGIEKAEMIFNIVFFVVLTSTLLQGTSIPFVSRFLGLEAPIPRRIKAPLEFEPTDEHRGELFEMEVAEESEAVSRQIIDLGLPKGVLIVLVQRNGTFFVPEGGTVLETGDELYIMADREMKDEIRKLFVARRDE